MSRKATAADVNQAIVTFADEGHPFAVVMVLEVSGSAPREAGTKAIVDASGTIYGTIGGGQVEAEAQRRAVAAIQLGFPVVFDFSLGGISAEGAVPVCGGRMRILVDPTAGVQRAMYAQAAEAIRQRRRGVLLTHIDTAGESGCTVSVRWLAEDGHALDDFPPRERDAVGDALASGVSQLLVQDSPVAGVFRQTLVEPVVPPPLLLIAGGGHVGQALALQGSIVGFQVLVIDDRAEFTESALYPSGTITRCGDIAAELAAFPLGEETYIAIVTRGHQQDQRALAACIGRPAAYIGMIGSKRKVSLLRQAMLDAGVATPEQFDRVHAPIGLDIGAQSVPEIAVSIVAQLVAVRRRGSVVAAVARREPV